MNSMALQGVRPTGCMPMRAGVEASTHEPATAAPRIPSVPAQRVSAWALAAALWRAASSMQYSGSIDRLCSACCSHACSHDVASPTRQCCQSSVLSPSVTSTGKQVADATTSRRSDSKRSRHQSANSIGASPVAVRIDHLLPVNSPRASQPLTAVQPCLEARTLPITSSPAVVRPPTVLPRRSQLFPPRSPSRGARRQAFLSATSRISTADSVAQAVPDAVHAPRGVNSGRSVCASGSTKSDSMYTSF